MTVSLGFNEFTDLQKHYVREALDANQTSRGPFTSRFEALISKLCGAKNAVFMCSGTCALHLALEARKMQLGWKDGAAVIVPATTFIASVQAVRLAGLTPVLCDVKESDYNMNAAWAWDAVKATGAVAVMVVHLLGRACDMDSFVELSDRLGVDIIEDCCEAFGVTYKGDPVGSFGVAGAISTYVSHHISTGTGGAVVTSDDALADKVLSLMQHGIGDRPHKFDDWGYSFRSTEMEAALGVGLLEESPVWTARQQGRRIIAHWIGEALKPFSDRLVLPEWPHGSVPMFYPIECRNADDRDPLAECFEKAGIDTRPMLPLVSQVRVRQMLREQGKTPGDYPVALDLTKRCMLIGCHPGMTMQHVEEIGKAAKNYFAGKVTA